MTHEDRALGVFGDEASRAVVALLEDAGVRLWTGAIAEVVEDGRLWMSMEGGLPVALAVALPRPVGRALAGVPHDERGFVPVDALGRVAGLRRRVRRRRHDDAAAQAGRPGRPAGRRRRLRDRRLGRRAGRRPSPTGRCCAAMLLTGDSPRFLRRGAGAPTLAAEQRAWWPPHKIAARELRRTSRRTPSCCSSPRDLSAACAAATRAIGSRNGEQDT